VYSSKPYDDMSVESSTHLIFIRQAGRVHDQASLPAHSSLGKYFGQSDLDSNTTDKTSDDDSDTEDS